MLFADNSKVSRVRSDVALRAAIESLEPRELLANYPSTAVSTTPINLWEGTKSFTVKYDSPIKVRLDTIDSRDITVTGPNGYSRLGKHYWTDKTINHTRLYARYKVGAPNGFWSAADNGVYQIFVNKGQVRDTANNPTRLKLLGSFIVDVPAYPSSVAPAPTTPDNAVKVSDFGAIPDDGIDDTADIQAAIDSLPLSAGVPDGLSPIGGYISFDAGEYTVSQPLRITSGMWLRGVGDQTILNNTSTTANDTAISIYSAYSHGGIFGARVMNMKIITDAARGIQIDPATPSDVNNIRLENLTISSGNTAVDCRDIDVYQSFFTNITVENPGAAALWLRVGNSNSSINAVRNFTVHGTARAGFDAIDPLVSLGGHMTVDGLAILDLGAAVVPLYTADLRGVVRGLAIATLDANILNGELMKLERTWVKFERISGISSTRRLRLITTKDAHFAFASLGNGSTLADSVVADASSHVTVDALYGGAGLGTATPGQLTVRKFATGSMPFAPGITLTQEHRSLSNVTVNVNTFGAFGNDPAEDTAAIQAAIDSLPDGTGDPTESTTGGTVLFPIGTYITTAPLRVPSGVWLVGNGWGSTIRNLSIDATSAAIEFVGNGGTTAPGLNIGAGVVNFGINTQSGAAAIHAHSSVTAGLIDLHLQNISIASEHAGIDLRNVRLYHARVDTVIIRDPQGTSLWMGDPYSGDNQVAGVQVIGNVVGAVEPDKAHVVLYGETTLERSWIELNGIGELPLYVSGATTISGLWCENHSSDLPDDVIISLENVTRADFDILLLVDDQHKLKFRNATGVKFQMLDIAGRVPPLAQSLNLDSPSRISIDTVNAIYDAGMLDDPRLTIGGVYNQNAARYTDTKTVLTSANLLVDPLITDISEDILVAHAWTIHFGDTFGTVVGSYVVEQTASGPRLKVVVTSDPNNRGVRLDMLLVVPPSEYGKQAVVRYRIDGPGTPIAWGEDFNYQYLARATNSLTAVPALTPISAGTELTILLPGGTGTFYISKVGLIANG